MLVLLAGIFVVHIATVIMLFVSTIANVWLVEEVKLGTFSTGLWKKCHTVNETICTDLSFTEDNQSAMKAVQAFMILAIIFSFVALVMFVVQLFTMEKGKRFFITGAIMLVCWLFILISVSIYTARIPAYKIDQSQNPNKKYHHGYSFILAWITFCFSFIIGVLYLVLRKK